MSHVTVRSVIDQWCDDLSSLFKRVTNVASRDKWIASKGEIELSEEPFGLGASVSYKAPLLLLEKTDGQTKQPLRLTFEPRYRFTLLSAGRVDIYSHPSLKEVLLLRIADTNGAEELTMDEAQERASRAPWKLFSAERLPIAYDFQDDEELIEFLNSIAAPYR